MFSLPFSHHESAPRPLRWGRAAGRFLLVLLSLSALAARELQGAEDEEKDLTRTIQQKRREFTTLQRSAGLSTVALAPIWEQRLKTAQWETGWYVQARAALQDRSAEKTEKKDKALAQALLWERRGLGLERCLDAMQIAQDLIAQGVPESRREEAALRQELLEASQAVVAKLARLAPVESTPTEGAPPESALDKDTLDKLVREAGEKLRGVQARLPWLEAHVALRRMLTRQADEKDEGLKELWRDRAQLEYAVLAAEESYAEAAAAESKNQEQRDALPKLAETRRQAYAAVQAWEERYRAKRSELRLGEEFLGAPGSLQPLIKEILDLRRAAASQSIESRQYRVGSREYGEREDRARALEEKAEVLTELARELRTQAARFKEASLEADTPAVQVLRAHATRLSEALEQQLRLRADKLAAARDLEAQAAGARQAATETQTRMVEAAGRLREELRRLSAQKERLADLARPGQTRALRDSLRTDLGRFEEQFAALDKLAPAQVALGREAWTAAAEHARKAGAGEDLPEDAIQRELLLALEEEALAQKLGLYLERRRRIEEELGAANLPGHAALAAAVQAWRTATEAATRQEAVAARTGAQGATAVALEALEQAVSATAKAEALEAVVQRLLRKAQDKGR